MNSGEPSDIKVSLADSLPASISPDQAHGPTLLVLAAGMGSRFGGLKQIAPVNAAGEAILDYSVYDALRAGFNRVVFVIRKEIEQAFKASVSARFERQMDVTYAYQELGSLLESAPPAGRTKPWGTLHATLVGAEQIAGPFAVINADDFYGADSYRVLAHHLQTDGRRSAMVGFRLRNTLSDFGSVSRGVCQTDAEGLLVRVDEMKRIVRMGDGGVNTASDGTMTTLAGDQLVSMNMWGLQPAVVPLLRDTFRHFLDANGADPTAEAYLPEAMNGIVSARQGQVAVLHTEAAWCGMTYREDYAGVVEHIRQLTLSGQYPDALWM